jgi:vacuolar-type H+-ATPase subunit H
MLHVKEILKSEEEAERILEDAKKEADSIISQARKDALDRQEQEQKKLLEKRDLELKKAQVEALKAKESILAKSRDEVKSHEAKHKANKDKAVRYIVEGILK